MSALDGFDRLTSTPADVAELRTYRGDFSPCLERPISLDMRVHGMSAEVWLSIDLARQLAASLARQCDAYEAVAERVAA